MADLVRRFGSPLYAYELADVDDAYARLRAALPGPSTLYYSLKANPHPAIAGRLRRAGCRAEISSPGELAAALAAGFTGAECLYTGPSKTKGQIDAAVAAGVRRFSVESATDFRRVADRAECLGETVECLIRVNPSEAIGSTGLRMTGTATQFGVDFDELAAAPWRFADRAGARMVGAHLFPTSNVRDPDGLAAALTASVAVAAALRDRAGYRMSVVDLGGGFAAPYAQPGSRPEYRMLAERVAAALDVDLPGWRDGTVEVAFESGRYLAGGCGTLACTVSDVKRSKGKQFVVLDSGINHLGGMSGLGRLLPVTAVAVPDATSTADVTAVADARVVTATASSPETPETPETPKTPKTPETTAVPDAPAVAPLGGRGALVGPLCTPADVLARDTDVGGLAAGDVVGIPNVGAYGLTASLIAFLGHVPPAEVVLDHGRVVDASRLDLRRVPLSDPDEPQARPAAAPMESIGGAR